MPGTVLGARHKNAKDMVHILKILLSKGDTETDECIESAGMGWSD